MNIWLVSFIIVIIILGLLTLKFFLIKFREKLKEIHMEDEENEQLQVMENMSWTTKPNVKKMAEYNHDIIDGGKVK